MSESNRNRIAHLTLVPSMLDDMSAELDQVRAAGLKPVEWLIRLEMMGRICEDARERGILSGEIAHIWGIKVRGSWAILAPDDLPVLVCEGDEYHQAILARYRELRAKPAR